MSCLDASRQPGLASMSLTFYFLPVPSRVIVIVYDGVQGLDVVGPAEVFAAANGLMSGPRYQVTFASTAGGPCALSSGARMETRRLGAIRAMPDDTVVVAGADDGPIGRAVADPALLRWLRRSAPVARRVASLCTGTFIL